MPVHPWFSRPGYTAVPHLVTVRCTISGPPCVVNGALLDRSAEPSSGVTMSACTSTVGAAEGLGLGLLWEAVPQPNSSSPSTISRMGVSPLRMVHPCLLYTSPSPRDGLLS